MRESQRNARDVSKDFAKYNYFSKLAFRILRFQTARRQSSPYPPLAALFLSLFLSHSHFLSLAFFKARAWDEPCNVPQEKVLVLAPKHTLVEIRDVLGLSSTRDVWP